MTSTNRDQQPDWETLPEELLSLALSFLLPYQRSLHKCLLERWSCERGRGGYAVKGGVDPSTSTFHRVPVNSTFHRVPVNSTFHRVASLYLVRFDLPSSNFCSTCRATKQRRCLSPTRLKSPGCNWNCVVAMHCSQPFRGSGQWFFVKPLGNQVGIGITCDPSVAGIRFHESLCGVYLDAMSYHHGKDEDQARNESGGVFNSSIAALIYQGEVVPNKPNTSLGVAVDLEKNEAWFTFPLSSTFFRRALPEHFRGKVLYACAQAWAGCAAHIVV